MYAHTPPRGRIAALQYLPLGANGAAVDSAQEASARSAGAAPKNLDWLKA